jgi:excinuclease ABC subunit B
MYSTGKKISIAMKEAIEETQRRRDIQIAYNTAHGIIPKTIQSKIKDIELKGKKEKESFEDTPAEILEAKMKRAELEMDLASANLDFEHAAELRDELIALRKRLQKFR